MKIWLIAGSSSGVGKTDLVKKLRAVLPNAEFLKIGHGKKKRKGRPNYFTTTEDGLDFMKNKESKFDHCIVESNRLVGMIEADVIIFLDSLEGDRRRDAKKLRSQADIILGYRANSDDWDSVISKLRLSSDIKNTVHGILNSHHEFLAKSRIKLKTKIWFGREGRIVFGEGLARLLNGIDNFGSLSKAAKEEGISYRHAWGDIKRAEEKLGFPLLERNVGGKSGGGSQLTEKARELLFGYDTLKRKAIQESDRWFKKLFEGIIDDI